LVRKSHSLEYKKRLIEIWNEIAPRYHKKWAKDNIGPLKSTAKLVSIAKIHNDYKVLDLACGTGAVIKQILPKIGKNGQIVGIDSSQTAIKIAKKWNDKTNVDFIISDAEYFNFNEKFDLVTCQYALFFFPNAHKSLQNIKHCLKKNGTLTISVHGEGRSIPFFSSILDVITKFIPDYLPPNAPNLDRFGTKKDLLKTLTRAGFTNIKIKHYNFTYKPGTFSNYWNDYLKYLAKPLKEKINKLSIQQRNELKEKIRKNTLSYTKNGQIIFPWKVLIAKATKS
jgi:ubiquinone/menaquinone biosynthesis C-methylase UbiE